MLEVELTKTWKQPIVVEFKPARRHHHRHRLRGQVGTRRLHAGHPGRGRAGHPAGAAQGHALRHAERPVGHDAGGGQHPAQSASPSMPFNDLAGPDRLGQGQQGQAQLRHRRRGQLDAPGRRTTEPADRRGDAAHPLQGRRRRLWRRVRRPCAAAAGPAVQQHAAREERAAETHRRDGPDARRQRTADSGGRRDVCRLRLRQQPGHRPAACHAARHHRQDQRRREQGHPLRSAGPAAEGHGPHGSPAPRPSSSTPTCARA